MILIASLCGAQDMLTADTFKKETSRGIVVVEFWASWNSINECQWLSKLNECEVYRIDIGKYMDNFSYINAIECLSSNSPFVFGKPWFNLQKPNDYLPIHTHNGVLSYSIWLKLPKISEFIFYYNGVVREFDHTMVLTPSDVGDFLFFPSRLRHAVHPFLSNNPNEIRISLSGNIYLQGVDDYIKGNNSYVRNTIEWNRLELL